MGLKSYLTEATRTLGPVFIGFTHVGEQNARGYLERHLKAKTTHVEWVKLQLVDGDVLVNGVPLSKFGFVFVGPVGDNVQLCAVLRAYVKAHGIPALFYGSSPEFNNKLLQTVLLKKGKVSQIRTVIGTELDVNDLKPLGMPLVSKITDGSQGKGVAKHDDLASAKKVLASKKPHIWQEFIPNDGDFRVFYVKDKLIYAIKRVRGSEKEFRNNVSLGGSYQMISPPKEAIALANAARKAMGFDVTGVDLIQHQKTKRWYVMEVNSAPQFGGVEFERVLDAMIDVIQGA